MNNDWTREQLVSYVEYIEEYFNICENYVLGNCAMGEDETEEDETEEEPALSRLNKEPALSRLRKLNKDYIGKFPETGIKTGVLPYISGPDGWFPSDICW